jgi:type IV pilus assembly protein PilB
VAEEAPVVKLFHQIISQAVTDGASDIYIEPTERDVPIRYRIDGVVHEVGRFPKGLQGGLISRLKVMADLDIAERRLPQEGRVGTTVAGKQVDLRVSTLPTTHGEMAAIQILDSSRPLLRLEELGLLEGPYRHYERALRKGQGAVVVAGPGGSGKSTTLYATVDMLTGPERTIFTVEAPVEHRLEGVNQLQANPKAGLTPAVALRSILGVNPDVVMIGDLGDEETALIGLGAVPAGHLILSTLNTKDAPTAVTQLIEMGIEPRVVASALECVVAQRLARRLCDRCKAAHEPSEAELAEAGITGSPGELFGPVGCPACGNTGYRGRIGLFEVMPVTDEIERLAAGRHPSEEIRRMAEEQGMTSVRADGVEKVRRGLTSLEEVLRVTPATT